MNSSDQSEKEANPAQAADEIVMLEPTVTTKSQQQLLLEFLERISSVIGV